MENKITPISAFNDNYIWMITHPGTTQAIVVDPGDATRVLDTLAKAKLELAAILLTHHHWDHVGGVNELKLAFPHVVVYGPDDIRLQEEVTHPIKEGDHIRFPDFDGLDIEVIETPGHTKSHVVYYAKGMLFTGDTLLSAGCGKLFEGTAEQMYAALQRLAKLPPETKVYCGHEYTLLNLAFAKMADPKNPAIDEYKNQAFKAYHSGNPTLPSTIATELAVNPFMRVNQAPLKAAAEKTAGDGPLSSPAAVLGVLRRWKDRL